MQFKMKTCPVWASSMVSNYKHMYKERYGEDYPQSNDHVFTIIENIHDDEDPPNAEKMRVEEMREELYQVD